VATLTVRIPKNTHETLRQLAAASGESMLQVLAKAIEEYRRARIWEQANKA
jgi:predicted transcriptional regulator